MLGAPRVKCERSLLKQRIGDSAAGNGQIKLVKVVFIGKLESFLNPHPTEITF